jgi:hypothetical protein
MWQWEKYKACCGSTLPKMADVYAAGRDGDVIRAYGRTMLNNRVQREASVIAVGFDEMSRTHVEDIEEIYSIVAAILDYGMRDAKQHNDDIRYTLGIVLSNALKSFTAAFSLVRGGWRLQPYFCIRNSFEALSLALHVFTNPQDFERFKQDELQSTKTFAAAKKLLPVFGPIMGNLSEEFVHVGKPFRYLQKGNKYSEDEWELWQCLLTLTGLMWFAYQVAELVYFHSIKAPIFWVDVGSNSYQLMPKEEAFAFQQRIAKRYEQYSLKQTSTAK